MRGQGVLSEYYPKIYVIYGHNFISLGSWGLNPQSPYPSFLHPSHPMSPLDLVLFTLQVKISLLMFHEKYYVLHPENNLFNGGRN